MCIRDSPADPGTGPRPGPGAALRRPGARRADLHRRDLLGGCLLYTSDAADERSSVDLGGRRIIKKKKQLGAESLTQTCTSAKNTSSQLRLNTYPH